MQTTFELLGADIHVAISGEHRFGIDAFLLSAFAGAKKGDVACDLCTGCGIVALLWFKARSLAPQVVHCIDIQPAAIDLLGATIQKNGLQGRVVAAVGDVKTIKTEKLLPAAEFDLVTCNPPYKAAGTGILSHSESDILARHESACSFDDVAAAARHLLRFGGRFSVCQRPERLCDVIATLQKHGLEPKRMRFVQKTADSAPWLVLIEAQRGAKPFLKVEPPLLVYDGSDYSPEVQKLYEKM